MRLEIDKERFKQFLDQFIGDAPFQIELVHTLLEQMPTQVKKGLIEELYYANIYSGDVFKAQHVVFKDDVHYFINYETLIKFLVDRGIAEEAFIKSLTPSYLARRIQNSEPVLGYSITKEVIRND